MELQDNARIEIDLIGQGLKSRLTKHYEQWKSGLAYKTVFPNLSPKAKKLGLSLDQLVGELESGGFVKVYGIPSGKRFVFAGDCPMTDDEILEWANEQEIIKRAEKAQ